MGTIEDIQTTYILSLGIGIVIGIFISTIRFLLFTGFERKEG